jgi:hypothetical protein
VLFIVTLTVNLASRGLIWAMGRPAKSAKPKLAAAEAAA